MSKLLFKVAKELNVGTGTIVEHLNKKGFDIDNKPNAKVTDDMFSELSKQFQTSIAEKEKADRIVIGSRPMQQQPPQPKKEVPVPIIKRDKPVLGILRRPRARQLETRRGAHGGNSVRRRAHRVAGLHRRAAVG